MNMISTGAFLNEMDASSKQVTAAEKFAAVWEKKNAKAARAGGVSLMALSLAACGGSSSSDSSSSGTTTTTTAGTNNALTTGIDTITGGSGADTVSGSQTTLNAGDTFTGGAGADMLAVFTSAAATIGGFTATDVETISVSATGGAATINMGNVSGETAVRVTGSDQNVTFSNTDNIATLELQYNSAGNATVTYNASTVSGTADAMSVALTDTTNGTVTLAGIETLSISNSGTSTVSALTTTAATTVNVTGSGTLTLTDIDDVTTTVDASGYSGTSTIGGFGASANVTYTGGSGNDTINMVGLTKDDSLDGGDGTDTLALTFASNAVATSTTAGDVTVSNVETLSLTSDDNGDAIDFDVFSAPAFDTVMVTITASADDVTLTDTQSSKFHLRNTNDVSVADNVDFLTIDLKDSSGSADTIDLTLQNRDVDETMTVATLTGVGIENINITADVASTTGGTSAAAGDITVTNFTFAAAEAVTVTGDADLTLPAFAAGVVSFDASTATGDQNVTFGAANVTATGGAGADTLNFAATLNGSDVIDGGAGTDTVTAVNVNDGADYDADLQLTNVERLTLTENESSDSNLTVDLNGTSLQRITISSDDAADKTIKVEDLGGSDVDLYISGVGESDGDTIELDLSTDGTADNVDVFLTPNAATTVFEGTLTLNDAETITIDVAASAAEATQVIADLDASDATSVVFTNDDTWDNGDTFSLTANSIKTGATIDFTGYNQNIGDAAAAIDSASADGSAGTGKVKDAATAMGTDGFTAVATGSYTILLGDGRTEDADVETTINLGASNTKADTIRFVDGTADTTNDIGVVVIDNFNNAANTVATHRSLLDLSAYGIESIADLTITAGELDDGEDVAVITATTSTDFAGSITLLGTTATDLAAADFVF
jgi:hypothetical protein